MKFRSILSFIPEMRTNSIFCFFCVILFSLQSLVTSKFYQLFNCLKTKQLKCIYVKGVQILPSEKTKAIWNSQNLFVTCKKTGPQTAGISQYFEIHSYF